jgi:predicted nucleotidyltransferase
MGEVRVPETVGKEKNNPFDKKGEYKRTLRSLSKNPFSNELSKERRENTFGWVDSNQEVLQDAIQEDGEGAVESRVIFIPHGSVARGHAQEGSDIDGHFWFNESENYLEMGDRNSAIQESFPDKDWGGTSFNVNDLLVSIKGLSEDFDPKSSDFRERFKTTMSSLEGRISSLFGPSSEKEDELGEVDVWRNQVIEELRLLNEKLLEISHQEKALHPVLEGAWKDVQLSWKHFFIDFEKRQGEVDGVINKKLMKKFSGDLKKVERAKEIVDGIIDNVGLPDLDFFFQS